MGGLLLWVTTTPTCWGWKEEVYPWGQPVLALVQGWTEGWQQSTAVQCPGNQSPLCTSSTIINQSGRGAASVQFFLSSPNTIHKLAFMQDWSCTGMQPHLTAQAPRCTWFWVELIAKGHRVLKLPRIRAGMNYNSWPTQKSFKTFLC